MREVSDKQNEIYEFLKTYTDNKGYPPSVREICEAVGLKSTSSVHGHLKRLESKGLIKRDPTKPRALEIIDHIARKEMVNIPIIGNNIKIKIHINVFEGSLFSNISFTETITLNI